MMVDLRSDKAEADARRRPRITGTSNYSLRCGCSSAPPLDPVPGGSHADLSQTMKPAGVQRRDQAALMQFFIFIMMENQFPQFDLDGFSLWPLVQINRLKQPLLIFRPAIAELILVKTFLGLHGSRLSSGKTFSVWHSSS